MDPARIDGNGCSWNWRGVAWRLPERGVIPNAVFTGVEHTVTLGRPDPIAYPHHSRRYGNGRGRSRGVLYLAWIGGVVIGAAVLVGGTFAVVSRTTHGCTGP